MDMSLWNCTGNLQLIGLGKGFYSCKIESNSDLIRIKENGPWFVQGNYLHVQPWTPNFQPSSASITSISAWLILPELPIEYHRADVLKAIGNSIGVFIKHDPNGLHRNNARFARISVHLDQAKPIPDVVWLSNFKQEVKLADKQIYCRICHGFCKGQCPGSADVAKLSPSTSAEESVPPSVVPAVDKEMSL
ncbi:uncharacterized protein LOC141620945 [Silene latifolia]|uniref:uncharacterized protein LOC141620945 n=1 Tax=Silene latifolia TaxID=37657 RepID=UPI003D78329C